MMNKECELRRAAELVFGASGGPVEVDVIRPGVYDAKKKKTTHAVFSDVDDLVRVVMRHQTNPMFAAQAANYYIIPNPLMRTSDDSRGRFLNGDRAEDTDIQHIYWLLVDVDPQRFSFEQHVPTTAEEKTSGFELCLDINDYLGGMGWPEPVWIDSGNGIQMWYRVDHENTDENSQFRSHFLQALGKLFDNGLAQVDEKVYNASRLCRLPGTLNCKGQRSTDRPYRFANILKVPSFLEPVSLKQIREVVKAVPSEQLRNDFTRSCDTSDAIELNRHAKQFERWMSKWGVGEYSRRNYRGGYLYSLRECPINVHSNDTDATHIFLSGNGERGFICHHARCSEKADTKGIHRGKGTYIRDWTDFRVRFETLQREKGYGE